MSWRLREGDREFVVDDLGDGSAEKGVSILVDFYRKNIGREKDIEVKAGKIDFELKKIRDEAEVRTGICSEDLRKREETLKEKEAIWLVIKKLMMEK